MTIPVTLYARPDCHLCEEAREAILALSGAAPRFELHEIDIDRDERLLLRYLERIPVVEVGGRVVSELEFDRDAFARALAEMHTVPS